MMMKRLLGALFTFTSAVVLAHAVETSFDQWADDFSARWVRENPQLATRTQYFSGAEQDALDRQLTLASSFGGTTGIRAAQAEAKLASEGLVELKRFPETTLTPRQKTAAAIIRWTLEDSIANA